MHASLYTPPVLVSPLPSISSRAISLANRTGRPKGSARGAVVASKGPRRLIHFESALEYKVLQLLSARPDVEEVQEQQVAYYVDEYGRQRKHIFDVRVKLRSGEWILVAVKPFERSLQTGFARLLEWIAKQLAPSFAKRVVLITERDFSAEELHNAELIHASRLDPDTDSDALLRDAIGALPSPLSIEQLVARVGTREGRSFRAIVRLIANGELRVLNHTRITHTALVAPASLVGGEV